MKEREHRNYKKGNAVSSHSTSWNEVSRWYDKIVGKEGHYYHKQIILPGILRLLQLQKGKRESLLDLACGQGILARHLPRDIDYCGIDLAPDFIRAAEEHKTERQQFIVGDVTKPLPLHNKLFHYATIILALQNIADPLAVLQETRQHLALDGKLIIVLNHPCFRIPRQSSWEVDSVNKVQYRRMQSYFSAAKVPIQMQPSRGKQSEQTWSFHHPLSHYINWLHEANFVVLTMEEWVSDKVSEGGSAKMENRARKEFPLFLTILAQAVSKK